MGRGIRAEVAVFRGVDCDVANVGTAGSVVGVARSPSTHGDGVVTEFTVDEASAGEPVDVEDSERVFSYGTRTVFRVTDDADGGCVCGTIEAWGCPVRTVTAGGGEVVATFIAADVERLRDVVASLKAEYDGVTIRRLTRASAEGAGTDLVFFDRQQFTDRQREVLRTAHERGYFEYPRRANAREVAEALDITTSTFVEHLTAAQSKLMESLLQG